MITERLHVYHDTTEPLIQYFRNQGLYMEVNGNRPVNEIFDSIMGIVNQD